MYVYNVFSPVECSVPTNPRIYSDILGVPLAGRRVKITCDSMFTQDGDSYVKCSEDGQFDGIPSCQISNGMTSFVANLKYICYCFYTYSELSKTM